VKEIDERMSVSLEPGVAVLTILNTNPNDTGRFAIELTNEFGTERMFSSVTIEGLPLWLLLVFSIICLCVYGLRGCTFKRHEVSVCYGLISGTG
jgi:hypothetical protein